MLKGVVAVMALTLTTLGPTPSDGCAPVLEAAGKCSTHTDNTGDGVDVGGTQTTTDSDSDSSGNSDSSSGGNESDAPDGDSSCPDASCPPTDSGSLDSTSVTISDLVRFVPPAPAPVVEPFGVGVVGLPSNVVTASEVRTLSATLLGWDVRVRFTPQLHRFDYGDGTVRELADPGTSWEEAGLVQFTPTRTSHVYSERGRYQTRVDILYAAEVDFGIGWRTVPGLVTARGDAVEVQVYEARTALVAHDCHETPTAPGC